MALGGKHQTDMEDAVLCRIPLSCPVDQCYDVIMERLAAYRFELCPDGAQRRGMRRFAGSCRYVYNRALASQKERYKQGEKKLGWVRLRLSREATRWCAWRTCRYGTC